MVRRVYVKKKEGFDSEAQRLRAELAENLGMQGIGAVRIINRYDVENIGDELFGQAVDTVFSDPAMDEARLDDMDVEGDAFIFGVEYLPGQFDQRADSAAKCIRLLDGGADPHIRYAKIIRNSGGLSDGDRGEIKKYCINPVDSRECSMELPATLAERPGRPAPIGAVADFMYMDGKALRDLIDEMGLVMSYEDLHCIQSHYLVEEMRDPTAAELRILDTYWSDHCRHSTFNTRLRDIKFEDGKYPGIVKEAFGEYLRLRDRVYEAAASEDICLMDIATLGARYLKATGKVRGLDESEENNACGFRVTARIQPGGEGSERDEEWLVMFKNETHNHPTEIEPFGGAATCLGGAIRDPLSGRSYVYQAMRVTGSGDPRVPLKDTLPGKLSQYQITKGAAKGFSSYGNQVGLATGQVQEIYDEGYRAKRMEIGAVIGAAPASHVRRERPAPGDAVILLGGRTGRDGIGGATGSSRSHSTSSALKAGAEVQKGDPVAERALQRLFRRKEAALLIKRCNDFGAGGVAVAIGELADSIEVNLDLVPKKYEGLNGTELAISESQERMAVVTSMEDAQRFIEIAAEENLEATAVGAITDDGRFTMTWQGARIFDLPRAFIDTNGAKAVRDVLVQDADLSSLTGVEDRLSIPPAREELFLALEGLGVCSQKGLAEQFDSTIGAGSVLMPLGGSRQLTPASGMAALLPVEGGSTGAATLMAHGFDPKLASQSPFHGAVYAVLDSVARIAAMGGDIDETRLSLQEYFEKLGKVPKRWGRPFAALLGALKAQVALGVPAIGGKDSMSGTFNHLDVPPTLASFAVAPCDAGLVLSPEIKGPGHHLVCLKVEKNHDGIPDFIQFRLNAERVRDLNRKGAILSGSTLGAGLFQTVARLALGNCIGVLLYVHKMESILQPDYGSLLVEVKKGSATSALFGGLDWKIVGETVDSGVMEIRPSSEANPFGSSSEKSIIIGLGEIERRWRAPLEGVFPSVAGRPAYEEYSRPVPKPAGGMKRPAAPKLGIARPRVFIPVFPGTNCEADTAAAFDRAGGEAVCVNFLNLSPESMKESMDRMKEEIDRCQIIALPGGFSVGDEPEGSAKFIAAAFRSPYVAEAVAGLLEARGGLILGICNGFQALVRLGLLPFGRITDRSEGSPSLTYNAIGRHVSMIVRARIGSVISPWLAGVKEGDVLSVPVSHGEGRFTAGETTLREMLRNGQVASQYADAHGNPTMDPAFNPNGSVLAIEGVTSADGRIFGKMGHVERTGPQLYKNVPGRYDWEVFRSGVGWFS